MGILTLYIVSKSGGLVFNKNFSDQAPQISTNAHLQLASTFFGMQEIANQVSSKRPVSASACGVETLECPTFILQAFRTVTGGLFFLTADPHTPNLKALLQRIYVLYSDYVMKNPFHQLDMPIRSELFDIHLDALIARHAATR